MFDSVWPHRRQPTRLPHPWDSPGKTPGVGCHFLLQCMNVKSESEVKVKVNVKAQPWLTLRDPMDCSPPGSSVHGISQARVLEWGVIAFSALYIVSIKDSLCSKGLIVADWQTWLKSPLKTPNRNRMVLIIATVIEGERSRILDLNYILLFLSRSAIWYVEWENSCHKNCTRLLSITGHLASLATLNLIPVFLHS